MNVVVFSGRVVRDVELKEVGTNVKAVFSLANNFTFKNKDGEKQRRTTFVDCECWGTRADILGQYVKKGDYLVVNGELRQDSWEKDGKKHSKLYLSVNDFDLPPKSNYDDENTVEEKTDVDTVAAEAKSGSDIPF